MIAFSSKLLAFALLVALLPACGAAPVAKTARAEAEQDYLDGMEHLAGGGLIEAEQDFAKVLKLPSYLSVTELARLRLGDSQFYQHKYDESIETYLAFAQRHDQSENVPYALYMVARAYFELAPSDLWFMPPVEELDLTAVQQARIHLERFLRQYPRSRYATDAMALREKCIDTQWAHSLYVINFYWKRDNWLGAVFRIHQAMQQFPTRAQTEQSFLRLATAYEQLKWRSRAVEMWQYLQKRFPDTATARRAPAEIARLEGVIRDAKKRGEAAEMPAEPPPTAALKPELAADTAVEEG